MGASTSIEWTDATWNPVRGCTRVSPGCGGPGKQGGCYAEKQAARFSDEGQAFHGFAERRNGEARWTGKVALIPEMLGLPLRWKKPSRIFINSMSDLFHEALPWEDIALVYGIAIAAACLHGHILQILTKRSERMRALLNDPQFWEVANSTASGEVMERVDPLDRRSDDARARLDGYGPDKPAPGIWLGVSVEDQERADERIPHLLETPAAVRFLSCEPLLGPVDLERFLSVYDRHGEPSGPRCNPDGTDAIGWVIVGGESGANARPMHPKWARALRDECAAAGVPFFLKQWGEWAPPDQIAREHWSYVDDYVGDAYVMRVGKKAAGRLLDGVEHSAFPATGTSR